MAQACMRQFRLAVLGTSQSTLAWSISLRLASSAHVRIACLTDWVKLAFCSSVSFECGELNCRLNGVVGSGYNGVDPDCLPGSECDQAQIEWMRKDLAAVVNNLSLSQLSHYHAVCGYRRI